MIRMINPTDHWTIMIQNTTRLMITLTPMIMMKTPTMTMILSWSEPKQHN